MILSYTSNKQENEDHVIERNVTIEPEEIKQENKADS